MSSQKSCVFSGSAENLNTSMTIKLDDGRQVEVWISDEYADQATPKAVKEAYLKKQASDGEQIRQLQEMAAKLGLKLVGAGEAPPEPARPAVVQAQQPKSAPVAPPKPAMDGNRVVSGAAADRELEFKVGYAADAAANLAGPTQRQYEITTKEKPKENLKDGEVAEIGLVKGRAGIDVAIPVRRQGKTGTTQVAVIDTGGDNNLQRRFKTMAEASKGDAVNYGKEGYDVKFAQCTACGGKGLALNGKSPCPKCKGAGEIQISRF